MINFRKIAERITSVCAAAALTLSAVQFPASDSSAAFARVSVHDPSVVKMEDGSYFIIGSHLGAATSTDLMNWYSAADSHLGSKSTTFFNDIYTDLAVPESWSKPSNSNYDLSGNLWAPDIVWNEAMGKYCMYLSINGDNWKSSIVMCTSDNVDGPYTYVDTVVYSGFNNTDTFNYSKTDVEKVLGSNPDISRYLTSAGEWNPDYGTNAIDPAVFYDENGALWMVYGSWFGGLFMLELDENTGLRDYNVTYPTVTDASDAYMGTKVAGGHWVSGEGPYIEYMEDPDTGVGYYYLFVSYGCFNNDGGYNMRVFRSTSPNGPYTDQNGNSAIYTSGGDNIGGNIGMRLMSNYKWNCNDKPNKAQGHNSLLMDDDGKLFVIYHNKFDDTYGGHEVRVHQLLMNEDGWPVAAPYEYSGETRSSVGHTEEAVTGDYEFIFHQLNQTIVADQATNGTNAEVEYSQNITLNADGTVSGDISGTWTMKDGSPEMTITYNGVTYKGEFIVQADESAEMTTKMTFTASGNNTCVWGSKNEAYDILEDMPDITNTSSSLTYKPSEASFEYSEKTLCGTDLLSDVSYFIECKFNGLVLDLAGGDTTDGTNIQQWAKTGGKHQEWRIVSLDNGYCKIVSMADESKCIAAADSTGANGVNVELAAYTGADNQQWKLVQDGAFYGIVSKAADDKAGLDAYGWSTESGGNIAQWEYWGGDCQLWRLTPVYPEVNDSEYYIRNLNSGLYVGTNGDNVEQTADSFKWSIASNGDGIYSIRTADGGAVTVTGGDGTDGNDIRISDYNGSEAQKFTIAPSADGSYTILSACSDNKSGFDVYGISAEAGANICQWSYWGGNGQKWIIIPAYQDEIEYIPGDVTCDGIIDSLDVAEARRGIAEGEFSGEASRLAADADGSGTADSTDLKLIQDYVLGRIDSLR